MGVRIALCLAALLLWVATVTGQTESVDSIDSKDRSLASVKWRCIGPFRGGRSVCATGVPGAPQVYFMGTTGGGVWKTDDAGHYWTNVSDGYFGTGSVGAIAVSPSDPNIVYVGMGEHAPRGVMTTHGDGIYKSTDGGKTWKHLGLEETEHISRIVIHPKNPDIVYVAAQGALHGPTRERGVYKSLDGGATWKQVLFVNDLTGCSELSMNPGNPAVLYASTWEHQRKPWIVMSGGKGSGVFKSTDAGETWTRIHEGLPEEKGKTAVAVAASNPEKVYALIEGDSQNEKGGLFVSSNGGENWSRVSSDHRLIQRAWYYTEVFVDPLDEHTVYVLSASAMRSIDGGKSWETLSGTHGDYHDLWINPSDSRNMVIANDGGAAISYNNGKTWSRQSNMPTAQFYRLNVDNQFPYRIYAGQQDNSSISIASMELGSSGITEKSWEASAGGESAFLAFDPDKPERVLGGSYLGTIEVLDVNASAGTKIMAAPIQYLGRAARDMKYLFNWNAPIIRSQHEPNTFYHAAQMLLRTRDWGQTWEEVSPDLTRNQDHKQGKGGGPLTVEAVGAENYGTISYVVESPHEKGVMWTGSDDGLIQLTRDGCKTWTNVTPPDLEECLINAIEVSNHDKATAYIATTRYKFNDKRPGLYKTTDYGKSWTKIVDGIADDAITRVVREDSERADLLFAGTEAGMYVSWDGGSNWSPFQLNLPQTPILDLAVRHGDLIAATSGRSIWILDDLSLIRQLSPEDLANRNRRLVLHSPEPGMLSNHGSELNGNSKKFTGQNPLRGVNPANGVVIYYNLPKIEKDQEVELEILDTNGNLVNRFSSKKDEDFKKYSGGPSAPALLDKKPGLNRFVWNLRYPTMPGVPEVYIEGSYRGHKVIPGNYTLNLRFNGEMKKADFQITKNPLYPATDEVYKEYHQFMSGMEKQLTDMHQLTNRLFKLQNQLKQLLKKMPEQEEFSKLHAEGKDLLKKLEAWDQEMVQRKSKAYDDVENFPNKFTAEYLFLINQTESDIPRVTQASKQRRDELESEWAELRKQAEMLLEKEIPSYNQQLWAKRIGALWATE